MHLVMRSTPCTTGQVHLLVDNKISYKDTPITLDFMLLHNQLR